MRNYSKIAIICLSFLLVIVSCKRESFPENSKNNEQNPATAKNSTTEASKIPLKTSNIIYKATEEEIAAAKNAWLSSIQSKKRNIAARGGCGQHISDFIFIDEIVGSCNNTSWDIKYLIYSYDYVGSGYQQIPVSANFTDMYFGLPISSVLLNSTADLVDPNCKEWYWDGYCEMLRTYQYQLTNVPAPSSNWPPGVGQFSLELLSGFSNNCSPLTVAGTLKGGFTANEYASSLARIYVSTTGPGSIFVATDCSLVCPPPNVQCPTGGVFQYWPVNNPLNITTINIPFNGAPISGIPTGETYGYSGVLNYVIGGNPVSSMPRTGTFTL